MPHPTRFTTTALLAALLMANGVLAQSSMAIVGSYSTDAQRSPEGGTHLVLLADSTYAVVYFGGARAGRWRVADDSLLYLTPTDRPAHPFALYGRHHSGLVGKTRIFYTGEFSNGGRYVRAGGSSAGDGLKVRRVFNEDANCFSFPNVDTFAGVPDSIALVLQSQGEDEGRGDGYTFANPGRYNDFVAVATDREESSAFRGDAPVAAIRAGGLYFIRSRHFAEREDLPTREEDQAFFRFLTSSNPDPDTVLYNPKYRAAPEAPDGNEESFDPKKYRALPGGDMLVSGDYEEGIEYRADYDFHDMRVVYVFRSMRPVVAKDLRFRVEGKPVFTFLCE